MDDDDESSQFCAEDIEMILQRRTQVIQHKPGMKGSSFAKVGAIFCKHSWKAKSTRFIEKLILLVDKQEGFPPISLCQPGKTRGIWEWWFEPEN